ncbi:hypothetical protein K469DRAFT_714202 [Zopfia rhizophila CBS 207.26]|uniref:Uncharacterized protein n=1 Tax=Zopfia rhizophila CBS 207.26 TaxID=1314779 RepID=A0A6A6DPM4_9PEZI|nr:hypothetical protein K469DRAFT_716480 [Zopfia rhizophila CBS 207.26]KAF2180933.1 hypothetical protein K469DRAFT_714127 [Zopfia rhizophila CBS 207.26]KAF2180985.1 hypothetical protein K469DRAFT_714202 [Zopfia rhizophila CBS 207.26]
MRPDGSTRWVTIGGNTGKALGGGNTGQLRRPPTNLGDSQEGLNRRGARNLRQGHRLGDS